jgi:hypothetical protein
LAGARPVPPMRRFDISTSPPSQMPGGEMRSTSARRGNPPASEAAIVQPSPQNQSIPDLPDRLKDRLRRHHGATKSAGNLLATFWRRIFLPAVRSLVKGGISLRCELQRARTRRRSPNVVASAARARSVVAVLPGLPCRNLPTNSLLAETAWL